MPMRMWLPTFVSLFRTAKIQPIVTTNLFVIGSTYVAGAATALIGRSIGGEGRKKVNTQITHNQTVIGEALHISNLMVHTPYFVCVMYRGSLLARSFMPTSGDLGDALDNFAWTIGLCASSCECYIGCWSCDASKYPRWHKPQWIGQMRLYVMHIGFI